MERVAEADQPVRIVVAEPVEAVPWRDTAAALRRLGAEVELVRVHDAAACLERARSGADLVVLDEALGPPAGTVLEALRGEGPPVVLVVGAGGADAALRAFRAGAADCVIASADYGEVLPAVALEQLSGWRRRRERRAAGRRVRDLRRYLRNIIQNMNGGLLVVGLDGCISAANPTAAQILGAGRDELPGRPVWEWLSEDPRGGSSLARALEDGTRSRGVEAMVRRPDGGLVPIGLSCAPLLEDDGTRLGAVAIFQDLSELKQLQRQVLQTEKMASIGQLAAGVAHEINNPMGFIHANLAQMEEYLADLGRLLEAADGLAKVAGVEGGPALRAAAERYAECTRDVDTAWVLDDFGKALRESQEGSERIRHIVQDLRSFAHRDDAELVPADLARCLDSTAHIVWTMMKHSLVLRKEYGSLPPVRCYPMQLQQVFMNLLVNAYQAIEQRMRTAGGSGEIVLRTRSCGDHVEIEVSDDGIGIEPDCLARIFDPFFTTKEVGVGTGLGLSTSFDIVRRHGGTLRAEPRSGGGTTFSVQLPVAGPAAG